MHVHLCASVLWWKVTSGVLLNHPHLIMFDSWSLLEHGVPWLPRLAVQDPPLCFPGGGITHMLLCADFTVLLEREFRFLHLHGKHFTHCTVSPDTWRPLSNIIGPIFSMIFVILSVLHELCQMEVFSLYNHFTTIPFYWWKNWGFSQVHNLAIKWKVQALVPGLLWPKPWNYCTIMQATACSQERCRWMQGQCYFLV